MLSCAWRHAGILKRESRLPSLNIFQPPSSQGIGLANQSDSSSKAGPSLSVQGPGALTPVAPVSKSGQKPQRQKVLGVFLLTMINVSAILSLRAWPSMAPLGFSSAFFWILDAIIFFIPLSLVSAELATGWPKTGGVYVWIREGLGDRWGYVGAWLYWIENVTWFPTVLTFISATAAYAINPDLASNNVYNFAVILIVFWGTTATNLLGMKASGWLSSVCAILGTILPAALIIGLAGFWMGSGHASQISFTAKSFFPVFLNMTHVAGTGPIPRIWGIFPSFQYLASITNLSAISLAGGLVLYYAGMEMSAVHAGEVKNPKRDFPKAVLFSTVVVAAIFIGGTLAVAIVVPQQQISLASGIMQAFQDFLNPYSLGWLIPVFAVLIVVGTLGQVNSWIIGPSKSLMATALNGDLPPALQRVNKKMVPTALLLLQGVIGTILALVYLFVPTVNAGYWFLTIITSQIYSVLYVMMFLSAIRLRYTKPDVQRSYKIPGGKKGMGLVAGLGIASSTFGLMIGFVPPSQIAFGSTLSYVLPLAIGVVVACAVPLWAYRYKKPEWESEAAKLGIED
jgi:amino acid transporter